MHELAITQENALTISADTEELIKAGVSENTLVREQAADFSNSLYVAI
ncbi:MAG: hypothetical protein OXN17_05625 [Candidatus Poribacteria bacterium]|nr:hypothetical protein [Candidatus Poribacteria bacterium]MDE0505303.1 hypothetical protein [Candidatus Poribacteria bacterium]